MCRCAGSPLGGDIKNYGVVGVRVVVVRLCSRGFRVVQGALAVHVLP